MAMVDGICGVDKGRHGEEDEPGGFK